MYTTGLVLQELLQGFRGPKARDAIVERFAALPMIVPDREDCVRQAPNLDLVWCARPTAEGSRAQLLW